MLIRVSFQTQRGDLGEDGDAALALEVVRIHRPFRDPLVVAEGAGLAEQHVDQGRLPMIDMGDDGDVAEGHGILCGRTRFGVPHIGDATREKKDAAAAI